MLKVDKKIAAFLKEDVDSAGAVSDLTARSIVFALRVPMERVLEVAKTLNITVK